MRQLPSTFLLFPVVKSYFQTSMDATAQQTLIEFYTDTKDVDFLEHAISTHVPRGGGDFVVKLEPVGLATKPKTVLDAKVTHITDLPLCGVFLYVCPSSHGPLPPE